MSRELEDPPPLLFKYRPPERVDTLSDLVVRFTQPSALNDPFELLPVFEAILPEQQLADALKPSLSSVIEALREQYPKLAPDLRRALSLQQVESFLTQNPDLILSYMPDAEQQVRVWLQSLTPTFRANIATALHRQAGLFSLSEECDNPVLWAHYAAEHHGFVIAFNSHDSFFHRRRGPNDEYFHLRRVRYEDLSPAGRTLLDLDGNSLLLTKQARWSYEREWRVLAPSKLADLTVGTLDEPVYLFRIPPSAIAGVILGARAAPELAASVRAAMLRSGLHPGAWLKQAVLDGDSMRILLRQVHIEGA
jgi:hypothetical protein